MIVKQKSQVLISYMTFKNIESRMAFKTYAFQISFDSALGEWLPLLIELWKQITFVINATFNVKQTLSNLNTLLFHGA